jgi:hypothetical protein
MAKLSAAQRRGLKPSQFAGPGRSYPVNDRNHAIAAKARAKEALDAGRMSRAEYDRIVAKANKVLGKGRRSLSEVLGG